jgi:hypothetical protein
MLGLLGTALALLGCGGGGAEPPPLELALSVELTPQGSLVTCGSAQPTQARLVRVSAASNFSRDIACPSREMMSGDFELSDWRVAPLPLAQRDGRALGEVAARTTLPAPVLVRDGERILALPSVALAALQGTTATLEAVGVNSEHPRALDTAALTVAEVPGEGESVAWRWTAVHNGIQYVSATAPIRALRVNDSGDWGALAISDPQQSASAQLVGVGRFAAMGLGALTTGRDFRDIRYVDLNNDGLEDVVSNVYGNGCTVIAVARPAGGYDIHTPLRADGSCIGGHGETILVADFDNDGLVDIFLPAYERFDYLKNLGQGRFVEMADQLGISFPGYQPHVEGAAAVDINLDGAVDMVVANEVLINDGAGHFTPVDHPFGAQRVFDEGMSVADIDGDGVFDIVKNDPAKGPRIFWGESATSFVDAGWMLGGEAVMASSYGLAVGDLFGAGVPAIVLAGGDKMLGANGEDDEAAESSPATNVRASPPPRVCVQIVPRRFSCLHDVIPRLDAWQDLLMITDVDGDGADDLVARYGTVRTYAGGVADSNVFRIDLRDRQGARNRHGQVLKALCANDGSFIALKAVDGGNGYMAQGNYVVPFQSSWCRKLVVRVPTSNGSIDYGPFEPGLHVVRAS